MPRARRKVYTLDSETDPFKIGRVPQPFVWGLYDGEYFEHFDTVADVVVRLSGEACTVYAHNGGKFDFHYMRDHINTDENIMLISGRLAKFRIGVAEFRDSMNLFTFGLASYQKEKFDYTLMEADKRDDPNTRAMILKYLKSDCVNLYDLVMGFFTTYGRSLTQAGAAMRVWAKMSGLTPPRQTVTQYEKFRPYYFGGRVQCFASGYSETPFKVMDINSAYPHAMLSDHPFSTSAELMDRLPAMDEWPRCFVRLEAISKGALPYIEDERLRKLIFPHDERTVREYTVTGWELLAALETDSITISKVLEVWRFPMVVNFREYVERFYNLRIKAKADKDKAQDLFAKIFLNALYGKFAANPAKYNEFRLSHPERLIEYRTEGWLPDGDDPQWGTRYLIRRPIPEAKQRFYNLATAASITGFVRAQLWRAIHQCKGVLYCDTDSIAATDVSGLQTGDALGQWKTELRCDRYAIAGKKLYAFHNRDFDREKDEPEKEWKTASKGTDLTPEEIISVSKGKSVLYNPEVPTYSVHRQEPRFIPRTVRMTA